jgi:hypothetical protein
MAKMENHSIQTNVGNSLHNSDVYRRILQMVQRTTSLRNNLIVNPIESPEFRASLRLRHPSIRY